jgi:hypothetical protein
MVGIVHLAAILRILLSAVFAAGGLRAYRVLARKNVDRIARAAWSRKKEPPLGTTHVFVCVADHFEPYWLEAQQDVAHERVKRWLERYPRAVDGIRDSGGNAPRHSFFYPQEDYDPRCMDMLAELTRQGLGEVEVHLHHDGDTAAGLRDKLVRFTETLHTQHGLLHVDAKTGGPAYAFIHGWTLDNRPAGRYCGVNGELSIQRKPVATPSLIHRRRTQPNHRS